MKRATCSLFLLLQASNILCALDVVCQWNQYDFLFPTPQDRSNALNSKTFIQQNIIPIDVEVDYRVPLSSSRIFVTFPRSFSDGVPVTLGYFKSSSSKAGCLIQPYPDFTWHSSNGDKCSGLTSVFRVAIDECKQMWVLDSGVVNNVRKCAPQLVVFNLVTDTLVHRYTFPESQYEDLSLFITPVLDFNPASFRKCNDVKVYIADATGKALIVYDSSTNKSWKIKNELFNPSQQYSIFKIAGESFDLMDGIFGLALSPKVPYLDGINVLFNSPKSERFLYFHALASNEENKVSLNIINNPTLWFNAYSQSASFENIGSRGIQAAAHAMDSDGNLFTVLMNPIALVCWDSSTPYNVDNIKIVQQNDTTLQFASGMKIVKNLLGHEEIWIMTNRFQKIAAETLRTNEVNFRVQVGVVKDLIGGRKCSGRSLRNKVHLTSRNLE